MPQERKLRVTQPIDTYNNNKSGGGNNDVYHFLLDAVQLNGAGATLQKKSVKVSVSLSVKGFSLGNQGGLKAAALLGLFRLGSAISGYVPTRVPVHLSYLLLAKR
ncbi:hypothetical protein OUZ56_021184 [Daphnia magna]|uniref:Uncharacterized protein n=1 Tax=Daphnia magna TaxID=35525 RepID=A0ABQ9ZI28_9CRUS|nr:hypothetical protein OUZ56_021184 [Daphnia magna]